MKLTFSRFVAILAISLLTLGGLAVPASANGPGVCGPENFAGGDGTEGNPYQIFDANSFTELRDCGYVFHYYVLNNDIALSTGWIPIPYFTGNLNGQSHSITGFRVENYSDGALGLFSAILDSQISYLNLQGTVYGSHDVNGLLTAYLLSSGISHVDAITNVSGRTFTGGLVGMADSSEISNVNITSYAGDSVQVIGPGAGGLLGLGMDTTLNSINVQTSIMGLINANTLGGIVGIDQSEDLTTWQENLTYQGDFYALNSEASICGGIAGQSQVSMRNVNVSGSILCESSDTGGVVGIFNGALDNALVEATVENRNSDATGNESAVGGLIGTWQPSSEEKQITNSGFAGTVRGEIAVGGLVGRLGMADDSAAKTYAIDNSYVNAIVDGDGIVGGAIGQLIASQIDSKVSISKSYFVVDFPQAAQFLDVIHPYFDFPPILENVYWASDGQNSATQWTDGLQAFTKEEMRDPITWREVGFDIDNSWGISPSFNDGYPILRTQGTECEAPTAPVIHFANNSSALSKAAKKAISKFAKAMSSRFCYNLKISGHTSSKEVVSGKKTTKKQKALSFARTNAVSSYFNGVIISLGKTTPIYIVKESKGATQKLNKDKTKAQQAANRRVVFTALSGG